MSKKVYTMGGEFILSVTDFDVLAKNPAEAETNFMSEISRIIENTNLDCTVECGDIEIEDVREDDIYDEE